MSNKSKVKAHIRRTKKGVSRVKEGSRSKRKMSIGKKIAIAGTTGVGLVGLGLAGKRLIKEVKAKKARRDFKPKADYPAWANHGGDYIIPGQDGKVPYSGDTWRDYIVTGENAYLHKPNMRLDFNWLNYKPTRISRGILYEIQKKYKK